MKKYTGEKMVRVSYSLDEKTIEKIRNRANELGISMSFYVRIIAEKDYKESKLRGLKCKND
jgi:hypothetical protein|nr:MAG TPA_asm: hypothetical protein [Caudoviricetes sp.]